MNPKERAMLIRHRDWLLNDVIPGFRRQHNEASAQLAIRQLAEINEKLRYEHYPRKEQK